MRALPKQEYTMSDKKTNPPLPFSELTDGTQPREMEGLSEETIDLSGLFTQDVSSSGSFDMRRSRLSSFGKLLEAIPIPTLLLDQSHRIIFANRACTRLAEEQKRLEGVRFSTLFRNQRDEQKAETLIDKVLSKRIPLIAEGTLGQGPSEMRGRIHFRAIRVEKIRTVFVIIEDITPSRQSRGKKSGKNATLGE
jgi:PAS domain-containing protein